MKAMRVNGARSSYGHARQTKRAKPRACQTGQRRPGGRRWRRPWRADRAEGADRAARAVRRRRRAGRRSARGPAPGWSGKTLRSMPTAAQARASSSGRSPSIARCTCRGLEAAERGQGRRRTATGGPPAGRAPDSPGAAGRRRAACSISRCSIASRSPSRARTAARAGPWARRVVRLLHRLGERAARAASASTRKRSTMRLAQRLADPDVELRGQVAGQPGMAGQRRAQGGDRRARRLDQPRHVGRRERRRCRCRPARSAPPARPACRIALDHRRRRGSAGGPPRSGARWSPRPAGGSGRRPAAPGCAAIIGRAISISSSASTLIRAGGAQSAVDSLSARMRRISRSASATRSMKMEFSRAWIGGERTAASAAAQFDDAQQQALAIRGRPALGELFQLLSRLNGAHASSPAIAAQTGLWS